MGEKSIVDHRRLIAVAPFGMAGAGGRVLDDGDFESALEKLAQMRFDAHVRQHAAEDDLADPPLGQLQDQIVGLRPPYLVRADDDGLPIFDIRLEAIQPVRARVRKAR